MTPLVQTGPDILGIFEPIYNDILFRSIVFDLPEGSAVMGTLLEFRELPANIDRLLKVLADENSDATMVAEIVQLNPAVAAKILRVVNSTFAGLRSRITNLQRAVALLGYDNVRGLILGMSLFSALRAKFPSSVLSITDLWKHSAAVGQIGNIIANKLGNIDAATLLSAGLLHDAGKLVLAVAFRERYGKALRDSADMKGELLGIELRYFGVTHPILAAALCYKWHLPERLWGLIAAQEHPSLGPDGRAAAALMLAEFFARSYGIGIDGQWAHGFVPEEACWHLSLAQSTAGNIIEPDEIKGVVQTVSVISEWE